MSGVWYDEAADISDHAADALAYGMMSGLPGMQQQVGPVVRIIHPLTITCKSCQAKPGERCTKAHRNHGRIGRGYHYRRKDDARLATEAVRALT